MNGGKSSPLKFFPRFIAEDYLAEQDLQSAPNVPGLRCHGIAVIMLLLLETCADVHVMGLDGDVSPTWPKSIFPSLEILVQFGCGVPNKC